MRFRSRPQNSRPEELFGERRGLLNFQKVQVCCYSYNVVTLNYFLNHCNCTWVSFSKRHTRRMPFRMILEICKFLFKTGEILRYF